MPLTVPEPTSAAAIAALTTALSGASGDDLEIGQQILDELTKSAAEYNAKASEYNAAEAAQPALLSAAIANANVVTTRVQALFPFPNPSTSGSAIEVAQRRLEAANRVAYGSVVQVLRAASTRLGNATALPEQPSPTFLQGKAFEANRFVAYLSA